MVHRYDNRSVPALALWAGLLMGCGGVVVGSEDPALQGTSVDGKKTTICHIPLGNPPNAHTITVGNSAVPAHLAHGDYVGPCQQDCEEPDPGEVYVPLPK